MFVMYEVIRCMVISQSLLPQRFDGCSLYKNTAVGEGMEIRYDDDDGGKKKKRRYEGIKFTLSNNV